MILVPEKRSCITPLQDIAVVALHVNGCSTQVPALYALAKLQSSRSKLRIIAYRYLQGALRGQVDQLFGRRCAGGKWLFDVNVAAAFETKQPQVSYTHLTLP